MQSLIRKSKLDSKTSDELTQALLFDATTVTDEAKAVIDRRKANRVASKIAFYQNVQLLSIFLGVIIIGRALLNLIEYKLDDVSAILNIACIVITAFAVYGMISQPMVHIINRKIQALEKESVFTDNFLYFKQNVNFAYSPDYWPDLFDIPTHHELAQIARELRNREVFDHPASLDPNVFFRLFALVNTYAFDSFVAARELRDEEAMRRLLEPFMQAVLEDILQTYRKQSTDKHARKAQAKAELDQKIDKDLQAFKATRNQEA